jgi:hypothetical protein
MWSSKCHLTNIASCSRKKLVQFFVTFCRNVFYPPIFKLILLIRTALGLLYIKRSSFEKESIFYSAKFELKGDLNHTLKECILSAFLKLILLIRTALGLLYIKRSSFLWEIKHLFFAKFRMKGDLNHVCIRHWARVLTDTLWLRDVQGHASKGSNNLYLMC